MTTDVLRLQGDYIIQTRANISGVSTGGSITFDLGTIPGGTRTGGTVFINGNLVVYGTQTNISTTDSAISDRTITLNAGEPTANPNGSITGSAGNQTSGLKISRGRLGQDQDQFAAFLEWNEGARWQGTGAISNIQGIWEFRVGRTGRPQYGGIKVNAIRIDEASASTAGAGAGQGPRLNIFGSDNPTAVLSVSGTNNYESRVTDDDDIPNKKYVDSLLIAPQTTAVKTQVGNTFITVRDAQEDSLTSDIIAVVNGDPDERTSITTGTLVMRLTEDSATFSGIQFTQNEISSTQLNADLILSTDGTGQIRLNAPLLFAEGNTPDPDLGETGLYVAESAGGGTGVFFKKKDLLGDVVQDEFISRKKALVYSIIFG